MTDDTTDRDHAGTPVTPAVAEPVDQFGRTQTEVGPGFVLLRNAATDGVTFVPDAPGVVEHHQALGWSRGPEDAPEPEPKGSTAKKATAKKAAAAPTDSADASA